MLLRPPYLALTSVFAFIPLPPVSDTNKHIEMLTLRHQLGVLQPQIDTPRPRPALTGRSSPPCSIDSPRLQLRQLQLIVPLIPSRAGTATSYAAATPRHPTRNGQDGHGPAAASKPSSSPGERESQLRLPTHPRRADHPADQRRSLHNPGDPQDQRHRARPRT